MSVSAVKAKNFRCKAKDGKGQPNYISGKYNWQGWAFVKDFDNRSRNLNELANERAFVFVFVFVKDGQPTSVCVKGYQGVSDWRVR